jgi:transcriptional regulator with XRE-family HTH domain
LPQRPKQAVSNREIGQRLKLLRQERGLTQTDLAQLVGLSQPNLSAIERGARAATLHQVIRFARALQSTTDEILLDEKAPAPGRRPRKAVAQRFLRLDELAPADRRVALDVIDGLLRRRGRARQQPAQREGDDTEDVPA